MRALRRFFRPERRRVPLEIFALFAVIAFLGCLEHCGG